DGAGCRCIANIARCTVRNIAYTAKSGNCRCLCAAYITRYARRTARNGQVNDRTTSDDARCTLAENGAGC
ncbi:MAG: hypothetical protein ACYTE0_13905, partial [Planctomycetota bacterium]